MNGAINVLLVEDDIESGDATTLMLTKRGLNVIQVSTGEKALEEIESGKKYDAIIADIRLTGMSGLDLLRTVRKTNPFLPVILLTGHDSVESAAEAVRLGAQDYILKPLSSIEELLAPITNAVANYRLRQENEILQQNLVQSETRLRAVLENSVDIIYRLDLKNNIIDYISPSIETVLGYKPDKITGTKLTDLTHLLHDDWQKKASQYLTVPTQYAHDNMANHNTLECMVKHINGQYRWINLKHSVIRDKSGNPIAIVGNVRDITGAKEAEKKENELREATNRIKQIENLGILAGGVAHDLNNIFMPLVSMPELIISELKSMNQPNLTAKAEKELIDVRDSGMQAIEITQDLLVLSQRGNYMMNPLSVNTIINEYFQIRAFRSLQHNYPLVIVKANLAKNIPLIKGCRSHMMRVFVNLVKNAMEAIVENGQVTIRTSTQCLEKDIKEFEVIPKGEYVVAEVIDNGKGISSDNMDKILQPFFTSKKKNKESGTGLGLAIVLNVIKEHKGYINVQSIENEGSHFSLYLPVTSETPDEPDTDSTLEGTGTIMVIDDVEKHLEVIRRHVVGLGYNVTTANSGEAALEIYRKTLSKLSDRTSTPYDLVLLDIIMEKGLDGLDVYREINKLCPAQKVVFLSGVGLHNRSDEIQKLGVITLIPKPITRKTIGTAIKKEMAKQE